MQILDIQPVDIANKTGISERTVKNGIWDNKPISGKLLRALYTHYQVSMDWLASGNGPMFCNSADHIAEDSAVYGDNPRTARIVDLINEWMSFANPDEQAWLETELKFKMHVYKEYFSKK